MAFAGFASAQNNATAPAPATQKTATPAQKKQMTPEDRAIRVLRMMTVKAQLTDVQQAEVKQILIEREKAKEAAKTNTETSKGARKSAQSAGDAKLKAAMTPEQWTKWEAFRTENKAKRADKAKETNPAAPANPANEEDFY